MMWLFSVWGEGGLPVFMRCSPEKPWQQHQSSQVARWETGASQLAGSPSAGHHDLQSPVASTSSQDDFCHSLPSAGFCMLPLTVTRKLQLNSAAEEVEQREAGQAR